MSETSLVDPSVEIIEARVEEFSFEELSIAFSQDDDGIRAWVEFPDDERDEIELEAPGVIVSQSSLDAVPRFTHDDGVIRGLSLDEYLEMRSVVADRAAS